MDEQRSILVVEDDEATRAFLVDNLAADGFRVVGATSPGEGVRAIEVRRPSLVVLDIALEGGSGLDLLDRVRHADGLASRIDPDLPVIVLSGRTRGRRPRAELRARRRRPRRQALPVPGAARADPRGLAARGGSAAAGAAPGGGADRRPEHPRGAPGRARRWSWRRRSSRCCTRWPRSPRAYTARTSCFATCGASRARARTRTLDAHACRLRKKLRPSSRPWVVNVRGVGYKLTEAV